MDTKSVTLAEEYYKCIGEKNAEELNKFLHPSVEFYGPLAILKGKDAVIKATCNFMNMFRSLKIRSKFGVGEQAMIVYDVDIPGINAAFPGASLLKFHDGQIVRIELFYDGSRFVEKKEAIFK